MTQMLIKSKGSVEIYVGDDGKFFATINDKRVTRTSVVAIEKLIAKDTTPVKVMVPGKYDSLAVYLDNISRISGQFKLKGEREIYASWDKVYKFDPDIYQKLQDIAKNISLCKMKEK